jgi:hypothetical protein
MLTAYPSCDAIKHALHKMPNTILLEKPWDGRLLQTVSKAIEEQQHSQYSHRA